VLKCDALSGPRERVLCEGSREPIPFEEGMFQRQIGLNCLLDLMEGEAEFTPPAQWVSNPRTCIPRGKYRDQCESVSG
jgi:hypothetical protein